MSTCSPCIIDSNAFFITFLLNNNQYTNQAAAAWEKDVLEDNVHIFNSYFEGNINLELEMHHQMKQTIEEFAD